MIEEKMIEKIKQLNMEGLRNGEIEALTGVSWPTITKILKRNHLRRNGFPGDVIEDNKERVIKMVEDGYFQREIADEFGVSLKVVGDFLRRNHVPPRLQVRCKWPFTQEQQQDIKHLRLNGTMHKDIADQFEVPRHAIVAWCLKHGVYPINEPILAGYSRCTRCGEMKPVAQFGRTKMKADGVTSQCKGCKKEYARQRLDAMTPTERREEWKRYRNADVAAKRQRERRKTEPKFGLNASVSSSIRMVLKGNKKGYHWESIVGYTLDDLMMHLEKQFEPGMTWANHGKCGNHWNIDHIIPISAFNFEHPADLDFKRCWSLANLRPLWAMENIRKGNRLEGPFQPCLLVGADT